MRKILINNEEKLIIYCIFVTQENLKFLHFITSFNA